MTSPIDPAVQRLIDREDIRDALIRYARGMDRHDLPLVASAFHPDGHDRHGAFEGGPDDVAQWAHRGHSLNYRAHNHYLTNVSFVFDGDDTCFTETYFHIVLQRLNEPAGNDILGGRYLDRFERRDGRWAIADREVVLDWKGEHLPIAPERDHPVNQTYPAGQWSRDDISYTRVQHVGPEPLIRAAFRHPFHHTRMTTRRNRCTLDDALLHCSSRFCC